MQILMLKRQAEKFHKRHDLLKQRSKAENEEAHQKTFRAKTGGQWELSNTMSASRASPLLALTRPKKGPGSNQTSQSPHRRMKWTRSFADDMARSTKAMWRTKKTWLASTSRSTKTTYTRPKKHQWTTWRRETWKKICRRPWKPLQD